MGEVLEAIRERIREGGPMRFDVFMERALYDPGGGYYASGSRVVGREGDFFTSVSVGDLFGAIVAEQCVEIWERMGRPAEFDLVEQGAHEGRLCVDIMEAARRRHGEFAKALRYRIVEPLEARREVQRRVLAEHGEGAVRWVEDLAETGGFAGVFVCNELVDALPCRRVRFERRRWRDLCVELGEEGQLRWTAGEECTAEVGAESSLLAESEYPEGYTTEIRPEIVPWIASLAAALRRGVALIVDYGFEDAEFFEKGRHEGTLRCYDGHRAFDDPFESVGERDISAHVNFTRLAVEARKRGLVVEGCVDQHDFLVKAGRPLIAEREGVSDSSFARQFQTLAHPGMMGRAFKVLGLSRGLDLAGQPLAGFARGL